ncbi:hypothetical protein [Aliikangiella sp. G2MR2-5]|uniref:DUF6985 domain-containing protein n=1 Tax=Aliikangiella sp. G2MR2-5 TaxID=2788943 RepID=UPI0018A97906|nr:hypothetical protein [Aliikangiella sp. G2MR2-5]
MKIKKQSWYSEFLGYEIEVNLRVDEDESAEKLVQLLASIEEWDVSFFGNLEPMLYSYYKETLLCCGETEPVIDSQDKIWKYVRVSELQIFSHHSRSYVMACGSCDWEEEHGLEIDIDEFGKVVYVGSFIGNGFRANPDNPEYGNFVLSRS